MKNIIKKYIDELTDNDIINFGYKNNIIIDKNEASILNYYLKNNLDVLLYGDPSSIISDLKNKLREEKAKKIIDLYYLYKEKYKDYL